MRVLKSLRATHNIHYHEYFRGVLTVFRDAAALRKAQGWAQSFAAEGMRHRVLSTAELVAFEPALAPVAPSLFGGIHYPD